MSRYILLVIMTILAAEACNSTSRRRPAEALEVSAIDVHHFVDALHRLDPADSTCAPIAEYLRQESRGLAAYRGKFDIGQREICRAVRRSPARYAALEAKLPALDSVTDQVKSVFAKFSALHEPTELPAVYFVVGNGISAGSTTRGSHPMILVGMELNRSTGNLAALMAHELVHTQQDFPFLGSMSGGPPFLRGSLLRHSIAEGSADFLAELVTGIPVRNAFGESHEAELWADFQREANGTDYRRWLYNGRDSAARGSRPPDLGYWIGYRITKSYYENAADKRRAIGEILSIRDFPRFLAASNYHGATTPASHEPDYAMISIPATAASAAGLRLETFIYRPTTPGPFPILVLSHGSSGGNPGASLPAHDLAEYFVKRGFMVVVPMRRGRGQSTGASREYEERHCDPGAWTPGLEDATEDLTAAIDYARMLPNVDSTSVVLAGVSRGGFLSVAYAAEGPRRGSIRGVINFVGAWIAQREDRCPRDFNALSFARFGARTRIPMLWLYGDRDSFNTTDDILDYADRFRSAGANLDFALIQNVPGNGHALPDFQTLWIDRVAAFLDRLDFTGRS